METHFDAKPELKIFSFLNKCFWYIVQLGEMQREIFKPILYPPFILCSQFSEILEMLADIKRPL